MSAIRNAAVLATALFVTALGAQGQFDPSRQSLPLAFVENRGQFDEPARFVAQQHGMATFVTREGFVVQAAFRSLDADELHGVNLFFTFEGASPKASAKSNAALPGIVNYLHGDDPAKWVTGVPTFSEVSVEGIYAGCDLRFHGDHGVVEYDLRLAPGQNADRIVVRCDGAESLSIDADGTLVAHTAIGDLRQPAPTTWQTDDAGRRIPVPCRFRLFDGRRFGFEVDGRDPSMELTIDPSLAFSGYLSGSGADECNAVTVDATGNVYLAGRTGSANFPKTAGAYDVTMSGLYEAFVTKVNSTGTSMVYSTYIGGNGGDTVEAIIVNAAGNATITGYGSSGFPMTTGSYDTSNNGWKEAFLTRLSPTGTSLVFSTYIGGNNEDIGNGLATDAAGNLYVCGQTQSTNFPTTAGAFDTTSNGVYDAFLVKLNPTATTLLLGTLIGGNGIDWAYDVAVTAANEPVVCGGTGSTNFPTTASAVDPTPNGSMDGFVAKFNASGTLAFSTVLGSPGNDQALDVALDSSDSVYVTGVALPGFPTTLGAYDTTNDNGDAFVSKISANGTTLIYSTFIGGNGTEQGNAICVDSLGAAYVSGYTNSTNLVTTPSAYQSLYGGGGAPGDALVAKLSPSGSSLAYCTYYGGAGYEDARGLAIDGLGGVYITGSGVSTNLPFSASAFANPAGIDEGYFAKFMLSTLASVDMIGGGCAASGPMPTVTSQNPVLGSLVLMSGADAPPNATVQVLLSAPMQTATLPNGCPVYVDPWTSLVAGTATTSANGSWTVAQSLPSIGYLAGVTVNVQAVIWSNASPWSYELSSGLALTLGY